MPLSTEHHYYEPCNGHGLAHDPFNSIIAPRPIGWVSTIGGDGTLNLAPYSFFNAFNYRPPIIGFGEVVAVHILRKLLKDGLFDTFAAQLILRAGGPTGYAEIGPENRFDMIRPP